MFANLWSYLFINFEKFWYYGMSFFFQCRNETCCKKIKIRIFSHCKDCERCFYDKQEHLQDLTNKYNRDLP